jgi:hypothetical protein
VESQHIYKGIASLLVLLIIPVVLGILFFTIIHSSPSQKTSSLLDTYEKAKKDIANINQKTLEVSWEFDRESGTWQASGDTPDCPDPMVFASPVDLSLASGILYPGQLRGGDYKPHGGVRFDGLKNNSVDVYASMDAKLVEGSRHWALGEVQYALYFLNDCGIVYKLDHLKELTPKFTEIINAIPMGGENDSRTTQIRPSVLVEKGEQIATKVGFESDKNVFLDFGVYDLRKTNGVDYSSKNYYNIEQYGMYAICWLNFLPEPDKTLAKNLPGADGQSGKESDYCK